MTAATLNLILHACDELAYDEQITLADKIKRRAIRKRRLEIKQNGIQAKKDIDNGDCITGLDNIFKEVDKLRNART